MRSGPCGKTSGSRATLADAGGELLDADRLGQPASLPDLAERLLHVHPERLGEQGVVADLRVRVEREMVSSEVQVGGKERLEAATLARSIQTGSFRQNMP